MTNSGVIKWLISISEHLHSSSWVKGLGARMLSLSVVLNSCGEKAFSLFCFNIRDLVFMLFSWFGQSLCPLIDFKMLWSLSVMLNAYAPHCCELIGPASSLVLICSTVHKKHFSPLEIVICPSKCGCRRVVQP